MHVAAALEPVGGLLGVQEFPATPAGYARLAGLAGWVRDRLPGRSRAPAATAPACPGTSPPLMSGSWRRTALTARTGAGRASPSPLDAVSAARAAQSGRARGAPKGRDGTVEAVRALMAVQAQRPLRADPDDQPGPGPDPDRASGPADPVRPAYRGRGSCPDRRITSPSWPCGRSGSTSLSVISPALAHARTFLGCPRRSGLKIGSQNRTSPLPESDNTDLCKPK
jgi:hypothetical protein